LGTIRFAQRRDLQPTAKAFSLITLLRGLDIPQLVSPELTGDWEFKLNQMSRGKLKREDFMREIADATREIVAKAKGYESDTVPGDFGELDNPLPECGGVIKEKLPEVSVPEMRLLPLENRGGPPDGKSPKPRNSSPKRCVVGPLQDSAAKWAGPLPPSFKLTPGPRCLRRVFTYGGF